jgi:hypothetical protein
MIFSSVRIRRKTKISFIRMSQCRLCTSDHFYSLYSCIIYFRTKIFPSTVNKSTTRFAHLSGRDWCNMYIYHCCVDLVDNLVLYLCGLATSSVDQPELCNRKAAGAIGPASRNSEMVTTPRASLLRSNHCAVNSRDVYFFYCKNVRTRYCWAAPRRWHFT